MKGRLIQIMDDGIKELYEITDKNITDKMIKRYWKEYIISNYDSFTDYLGQHSLGAGIERVFVDEITI